MKSPETSSGDNATPPTWVAIVSHQILPLLVVSLIVLVVLRLVGPYTRLWFDQAILWSILAMTTCLACFSAATVVDHLGRQRSQPISGPLIAIGFRTGGVALAAGFSAVLADKGTSHWFLTSLVCFYVASLIIHTWIWSRVLRSGSEHAAHPKQPL
jgi:hypothetical protein